MSVLQYACEFCRTINAVPCSLAPPEEFYIFILGLNPVPKDNCSFKPDNSEWTSVDELISYAALRETILHDAARPGVLTIANGTATIAFSRAQAAQRRYQEAYVVETQQPGIVVTQNRFLRQHAG